MITEAHNDILINTWIHAVWLVKGAMKHGKNTCNTHSMFSGGC